MAEREESLPRWLILGAALVIVLALIAGVGLIAKDRLHRVLQNTPVAAGVAEVPEQVAPPAPVAAKPIVPKAPFDPQDAKENPEADFGTIEIRIRKVHIGSVCTNWESSPGVRQILLQGDNLQVEMRLYNPSKTAKITYTSWADSLFSGATLLDDLGNRYHGKVVMGGQAGQVSGVKSLYPGEETSELLVFERPVPGASHLILTLPGKNVESTGQVRFKLQKSMWHN